ncbi:MAG: transposase [Haemophilus parainfluenzae]|uniref:transposase n=1 Tax=Peptostreptococcus sp. TaxID=1262 RepID=UPI00290D4CE5|nr:transposase [Haemophilus parainfluenzae]
MNPRCGLRKECQPYAKIWNASNPKQIETNPAYDALLADNQKRLISAEGIQLRTKRSIQVEGTFGVLKEDFQFKRFNHRGKDNVHKMLYIRAMRFNLAKLHNRIQSGRINKTLFEIKEVA